MPVPGTTLTSYRPLMQGANGMVVASHPSAAMAGLDILRRGGNAIDAGVAVGLALNVVHVDDCSFLGVAPTIMYLADRREVTTIDGLGVWPRAASVDYFKRNHGGLIPPGISRSLTPAAADAWITALSRFGTMTFADVSAAAADLAGNGFPMYRYLSDRLHTAFDLYNAWPTTAQVFLPNGRAPRRGEMFYQRDLAATLATLAEVEASDRGRGRQAALQAVRDYVYVGELGKKIAAYSQEQCGLISEEDMASCRVSVEPPVSVSYRGYQVYCTGPWGQGPTGPQALKILEGFDLASMGHNSAEYVHTVSQALNLAFADRERYVGDPRFVDVPIDDMLSDEYLAQRRSLIDPDRAWPGLPPAGDPRRRRAVRDGEPRSPGEAPAVSATAGDHGGGTSYFAVIDREGNVFSCTPSEGTKSGGPIIPGTGLAFSLRGYQSKVDEGHPSSVEPGKRPRLTPAPALVLREGEPVMAVGAHGGDHIPQGTVQLLLNVLEFGRDPQEAVEEPRFYSYSFPSSSSPSKYEPGMLRMEGRIPNQVTEALRKKGHVVERYPDWWEGSALYCMITRDPATGVLRGGADPRCEAYAVGY
ncbi:MAG: gamma-glutamyltransferase family protein [Dehalococcoidia bacterium]|nr:gamma-glutamyltransferase family protein [Dehalococcoidia bacterium]